MSCGYRHFIFHLLHQEIISLQARTWPLIYFWRCRRLCCFISKILPQHIHPFTSLLCSQWRRQYSFYSSSQESKHIQGCCRMCLLLPRSHHPWWQHSSNSIWTTWRTWLHPPPLSLPKQITYYASIQWCSSSHLWTSSRISDHHP